MTIDTAKLKAVAEKAKDNFIPSFMISTRDVLELIAALEAKDARIVEFEARTVSVKLPEPATEGGRGYRQKVIWALQGAFFDAGINLETGGE